MEKEAFLNLVVESLEAVDRQYGRFFGESLYERVFCYEFYHQLRLRLTKRSSSLVLHGDLEKRYREIDLAPDFIFHLPDVDEENFVVIEVKTTERSDSDIERDLSKLRKFMLEELGYQVGLLIIIGPADKLEPLIEHLFLSSSQIGCQINLLFYDITSGKVKFSEEIHWNVEL